MMKTLKEIIAKHKKTLFWIVVFFLVIVLPIARMITLSMEDSEGWFAENIGWMYWTVPSSLFFGGLFLTLIGMSIWDEYRPNVNRKGFLPMVTSRGDRLFIGIISTIGIHLIWILIIGLNFMVGALILSATWFYIEAQWG